METEISKSERIVSVDLLRVKGLEGANLVTSGGCLEVWGDDFLGDGLVVVLEVDSDVKYTL